MENPELGIYVHIPFCIKKCIYCDFVSYPNKLKEQNLYTDKVIEEIEERKERFQKYDVTTIYFGGGTPSCLDSANIIRILNKIYEVIGITNSNKNYKEIETTIEVNPGTTTKQKLKEYKEAGFNRLSIGLQSSNNEILKMLGRIHTFENFMQTYKEAREVGFGNINVDIMIGLPNQTVQDIKETIEKVLKLKPEHISAYSLILEENTKMTQLVEQGILQLPDEEMERREYWYMKNKLELAGYKHYEISNFAKPSMESKHNVNCWNQKEYLGFGVAAHSYENKIRYSNTINLDEYLQTPNISEHKIVQEKQDKIEEEKEFMLLGLRKIEGISVQKFKEKFGENPIYLFRQELEKLVQEDLIEVDLDQIKLTNKGLDFANLVWEEFV